jgi:hypothetical protein
MYSSMGLSFLFISFHIENFFFNYFLSFFLFIFCLLRSTQSSLRYMMMIRGHSSIHALYM